MQIKINDYYYSLVPRPSKTEYNILRESIRNDGVREKIIINKDGIILDGHTRYEISQNLGCDIKYEVRDFKNKLEEKMYVIQANLQRRQLNTFQKIELLYDDYKNLKQQAKNNISNGGHKVDNPLGSVNKIMGFNIGANHHTVRYAISILESDNKKIISDVRNGNMSINRAYYLISDKNPVNKRNQMPVSLLLNYFKNDIQRYEVLIECVDIFNRNVCDKLKNNNYNLSQRCRVNRHYVCKNKRGLCKCPCHTKI